VLRLVSYICARRWRGASTFLKTARRANSSSRPGSHVRFCSVSTPLRHVLEDCNTPSGLCFTQLCIAIPRLAPPHLPPRRDATRPRAHQPTNFPKGRCFPHLCVPDLLCGACGFFATHAQPWRNCTPSIFRFPPPHLSTRSWKSVQDDTDPLLSDFVFLARAVFLSLVG